MLLLLGVEGMVGMGLLVSCRSWGGGYKEVFVFVGKSCYDSCVKFFFSMVGGL